MKRRTEFQWRTGTLYICGGWVGVCVCVSVLVGGDGITGGRQGVRT